MSATMLSCNETPFKWSPNVSLDQLTTCATCGIRIFSNGPGSLQILTRRQGGVGDGVNIVEDAGMGADYRGQQYVYEESVFHAPGLHVFPGQTTPYPAEYHIHMRTAANVTPSRSITIVVPASYMVEGPGRDYYAAMSKTIADVRPSISTLLPPGSDILQYQGPDIRGRTKENLTPDSCSSENERQFLLVLRVTHIDAADINRIYTEGSLSTDLRDWPAPGPYPTETIPTDRILTKVILAKPGILGKPKKTTQAGPKERTELECKPLKIVDGKTAVDVSGKTILLGDLYKKDGSDSSDGSAVGLPYWAMIAMFFLIFFLSIVFWDWVFTILLWNTIFKTESTTLQKWSNMKILLLMSMPFLFIPLYGFVARVFAKALGL